MAKEIERKFLLTSEAWRAQAAPGTRYRQGYLANSATCSVRARIAGDKAYLNLKSITLGVSRTEFDYPVPLADAEVMLATLCAKPLIEKIRYLIPYGQHTWEIDEFEGDNAGLVVAEIELSSEDEAFECPPWLGEEVSHDPRYYNVCLVRHPYKDW